MNTPASHFFSGWNSPAISTLHLSIISGAGLATVIALLFLIRWSRRRQTKKAGLKIAADHYDIPTLAAKVQNLHGRPVTVLLAASSISDLPVTVPVNLAIQLSKKGKCLLIDLDLNRNSIARVFELPDSPEAGFHVSSIASSIENLYIWPARHFETLHQMNLRVILQEAQKKYDYILLYAPYLTTLADRRQIAGCVRQALVFGKPQDKDDRLITLLESQKCRIASR
jgi:Mrp family chromosome partitioning ATPase